MLNKIPRTEGKNLKRNALIILFPCRIELLRVKNQFFLPYHAMQTQTSIFFFMKLPLQKIEPGEKKKFSLLHLAITLPVRMEQIFLISFPSGQQGPSDLPEHLEVLRSMSVMAVHTGKATRTGMSTLPDSPKQCSKVPSSGRGGPVDNIYPLSLRLHLSSVLQCGQVYFLLLVPCFVSLYYLILAVTLSVQQTEIRGALP